MTPQRYKQVFCNLDEELTPEEIANGWHFCGEFDSLLVGPGMPELGYCTCDLPESAQKARSEMVARENRAWTGGDDD